MRFDVEVAKYCGKTYRVQYPCIILADMSCRAECTSLRLGCSRAVNAY